MRCCAGSTQSDYWAGRETVRRSRKASLDNLNPLDRVLTLESAAVEVRHAE